jgi:hypothetical protein
MWSYAGYQWLTPVIIATQEAKIHIYSGDKKQEDQANIS